MSLIKKICAWIIGLVFFVSSLTKIVDPVGTGLIVEAYCKFFHLGFLIPVAKFLGACLSMLEMTVALALMTGFRRVIFAWITFALLTFFSVISVLLLIFNPDMDCGCFGQFIHLTHLQTFIKNMILAVLAIPAFIPLRSLQLMTERKLSFCLSLLMVLSLSVYIYLTLPIVESTDFKVSNTIVPDESSMRDADNVMLTVWDECGEDRSLDLLQDETVLISVYDPESLGGGRKTKISRFAADAQNAGYQTFLLSVSSLDVPGLETLYADYRTLKTLNRSNGGTTFLDEGYIYRKHSNLKYLSFEELDELYTADSTEIYAKTATKQTLALQFYLIALFAVLLLF